MKNKIRKTGIILAVLVIACMTMAGAVMAEDTTDTNFSESLFPTENVPVDIIIDYKDPMLSGVIQLPEVTSIDDAFVLNLIYELFGPDSEATIDGIEPNLNACSCIYVPKETESGQVTLMGRNLDLDQSECPAWIFYTDVPGRYKSFNMGYLENALEIIGLPAMSDLREDPEIPQLTYQLLSYIVTDAINEKGLVIEVDMRNQNDALYCTGTNPSSPVKVCNGILIRYLIDRCATIDDVLELVKDIDVYSPNPNVYNCQFALSMMDATGRCGVMEFYNNQIIWHDGSDESFWGDDKPGQTNFWITPGAYEVSNSSAGESRYESLQNDAKTITSESDMWNALSKVYRKQFFTEYADETTYDVISDCDKDFNELFESSLSLEEEGVITLDPEKVKEVQAILDKHPEYKDKKWDRVFLNNPDNHDDIITCYNYVTDVVNQLIQNPSTQMLLRKTAFLEYSAISYVVESGSTQMKVRFFENPKTYTFGFSDEPDIPVIEKNSSSTVSFRGIKDGNDFTFKNAVVIKKATLPGATSATVINNGTGTGWYKCTLSTDGFEGNGVLYFQVPLEVIDIKGWTVNDVSLLGCPTTYLGTEDQYAKYSAVIEKDGTYTIGFEKDAAAKQVTAPVEESKKVTETTKAETTPVTATKVDTPAATEQAAATVKTADDTTKTQTTKSPFPFFGILAGLGATALFLRRKN